MDRFVLKSGFEPAGDQPQAISRIVSGVERGLPHQTLLGVTGSGKTFTMANVIAETNRPALVLAHNKTLAAQLYREFKELFPDNAVEYFVSYYDYYQPEAYMPSSDIFIEKDSAINEELDKMRLAATKHLIERRDVIVVSSVSCIYGIGSPADYNLMVVGLEQGQRVARRDVLRQLVDIQYTRGDHDFHRGTFRARGDIVDIYPAYEEKVAIRISFFGDEIESLHEIDALTGSRIRRLPRAMVFPSSHYVTTRENLERAMGDIEEELRERLQWFRGQQRLLEAQRIEQRTKYDLELLHEAGVCPGIENYSRHLTNRQPGEPPFTLIDYFPKDFLLFVDESHVTLPQVRAMYEGDRSRKTVLVEHGFRLPSALDNRPLKFDEFWERLNQVIYVSATPAPFELEKSGGFFVEQLIRPTGLIDPVITVKPATGQVEDALGEIRECVAGGGRVLVTTLTKRMSEDIAEYLTELGVKAKFLHSDIDAIERTEIIRDLRRGDFDTLVGVNLLREGLDLPEVSLVVILDADKEGFLRGHTALIQTCGRAARNIDGRVLMYADTITEAIRRTLEETDRRRTRQTEFNNEHGITPQSVRKEIHNILGTVYEADYVDLAEVAEEAADYGGIQNLPAAIERMRKEMREAAAALEFEKAAQLRDRVASLQRQMLGVAQGAPPSPQPRSARMAAAPRKPGRRPARRR